MEAIVLHDPDLRGNDHIPVKLFVNCSSEYKYVDFRIIMSDSRMHLKVFGNTFGMISRRNLFM